MPKREWEGIPEDAMVLSQSVIGSLELSPCRVTTLPRGYRTEPSVAMFQGTVEHALCEATVGGEGHVTKVQSILDIADELWSEEAHLDGKSWTDKLAEEGHDPLEWASQMSMLHQSWLTGPWALKYSEMELVEAEVPRARQLGTTASGKPLFVVTGGIDAIFRDRYDLHHIVDWKTAGRPWGRNDGHGLIQDDVYVWLLDGEYGEIADLTFTFEVGAFSNLEWRSVKTVVSDASIHNAMERIKGWADFLDLENRPHLCTPVAMKARGWWARPNYNHGHCPTCKFLGDEYDAEWLDRAPDPLIKTGDVTT